MVTHLKKKLKQAPITAYKCSTLDMGVKKDLSEVVTFELATCKEERDASGRGMALTVTLKKTSLRKKRGPRWLNLTDKM